MAVEPPIAFAAATEPAALEVRVNFGVFAGRHATAAEIDELAKALLPEVGEVAIVAEDRHQLTDEIEVALHQVRIEVAADRLPADAAEHEHLTRRLVEAAEAWARACIANRQAEVSEL